MKNVSLALTLLLAGSLTTAQTVQQKARGQHGRVEDAAAATVDQALQLEFRVIGLTEGNYEQARANLTALKTQVYSCSGCKHEQVMAGTCAPCKAVLTAKTEPMLREVVPSVANASIRLVRVGARTLHYSELVSALTKASIQVDAAKLPLAGSSHLVLRGGTLANAEVIEKGLVEAKLFETADASFDASTGEIHIEVRAGKVPPMHASVSALIDTLGTKAKLADVIWGPTAPPTKT